MAKGQILTIYITILPWYISYAMVLVLDTSEIVKVRFKGLEPRACESYNTYTLAYDLGVANITYGLNIIPWGLRLAWKMIMD